MQIIESQQTSKKRILQKAYLFAYNLSHQNHKNTYYYIGESSPSLFDQYTLYRNNGTSKKWYKRILGLEDIYEICTICPDRALHLVILGKEDVSKEELVEIAQFAEKFYEKQVILSI